MSSCTARWFILVALAAGLAPGPLTRAAEQTNSVPKPTNPAAAEKEGCIRNLKVIYDAIQAYQNDHKDLPNWLSDLVPQYLPDVNVLTCPVCRRTGQIEAPPLADPKLASSYLFEFCPVPLGAAATNAPTRTRREWKRRQMGLAGAMVPIVRCRHHSPVLNLGFDGQIYTSPPSWETLLTNRVDPAELKPDRMFAEEGAIPSSVSEEPPAPSRFPPREKTTRKELLDLTDFFNASLEESWHGNSNNDLGTLPKGLQTFAGVPFDIRGIVQLQSKSPSSTNFPSQIKGIKVSQKCQHVHFLHAAGFGNPTDEGKQIGAYVVHFAKNQMRLEIPIRYGREVRNWHGMVGENEPSGELTVAWTGENGVSKRMGRPIRLFLTTWTNVAPDVEIESLDYVSAMQVPAPFLIAITVD